MTIEDALNDPKTRLAEVYTDWTHSRALLRAAQERVRQVSHEHVQIILENAVMHRLLHSDEPRVRELFGAVDAEALMRGFDAVGRQDAASAAIPEFLAVLSRPWPESENQPDPVVQLTDEALICGEFSQPLVSPVRRLLTVAFDQYDAHIALGYVARCALRYASVYAKTRHIGPPQGVYDDFYAWGVRNEGFASPFNARLLGVGRFFSAFPDTDHVFGSQGSLFQAQRTDHPGAWCLDPPFLPKTMARTVETIRQWRKEKDCPAILLIVPASFKPDYPPDETVHLKAGNHCYTGLDGVLRPLPVDVAIHRFGGLPGFDAGQIQRGYLPPT